MTIDITLISDLHGYKPKLPGGDLLIIAGDLTARDTYNDYVNFNEWMIEISRKYEKTIIIAGNHDNGLLPGRFNIELLPKVVYLFDSGITYKGLKIWGSPWTHQFRGQNNFCKAFSLPLEIQMQEKWEEIPNDIDILITHSPPFGILDETNSMRNKVRVGCPSLLKKVMEIKPKIHVFGHIHENGGKTEEHEGIIFANASQVDEDYELTNKPIIIAVEIESNDSKVKFQEEESVMG